VRCANSGISSIFDRYGRATAQTENMEQAVIEGAVDITGERSIYTFAGDWFPLSVSAIAAAICVYLLLRLLGGSALVGRSLRRFRKHE
jgi:apolipoprotein N-acyltransferase